LGLAHALAGKSLQEEVPLTDPFDYFDQDAIRDIVRQAQARRSREWSVAWRRALRFARLGWLAGLMVYRRRLLGAGVVRPIRQRPLAKSRW